jgi:hypothetical protein
MSVDEPMPTIAPKAVEMFIRGNVAAKPDSAKAFTPCPMKMLSTMLYNEEASIAMMEGMAYCFNNSPTGRVPSSLGIFFSVILLSIIYSSKLVT